MKASDETIEIEILLMKKNCGVLDIISMTIDILTPLEAQYNPKRCKIFELQFRKNPPIAAPLLRHIGRKSSTRVVAYQIKKQNL